VRNAAGANDEPCQGPLPPALFLVAIGLEILLRFALPAPNVIPVPLRGIGALFLAAGLVLTVAADAQFKRVRTEINPFRRPTALVIDGAFRFTRNPMYLGLVMALVGIALLLGSVVALVVPPLFAFLLEMRFIRHEERAMAEQFGGKYAEYAKRVRRWI
jgi:protein-S-isoprenylcysteine O-methyltransferase Ste14